MISRSANCNTPELREVALQCAKTCSACCLTSTSNCGDNPVSPINCNLNANKCSDSNWTLIMNEYCPATCGTCLNRSCGDRINGCDIMRSLCSTSGESGDYVRKNCRRTCNLCSSNSVISPTKNTSDCVDAATNCATNMHHCNNSTLYNLMTQKCARTCNRCLNSTNTPTCSDSNPNCFIWVRNGFCTSHFYTLNQKRQYCGQSCNLCDLSVTSMNTTISPCTDSRPNCNLWVRNGFCNNTFYTLAQRRQYCGRSCNLC